MTDAARTGTGTQVHLVDAEGRSGCGVAPSRLTPTEQPWAEVPDHERCHTCQLNEHAPRSNAPPWWQAGPGVDRDTWARQREEFPAMETPPGMPERLRITDAAAFLGVSRQRLQQLIRADRLPKPDALDKRGPIWNRGTIETWAREQWWGRYRWRTPG